MNTEISKPFLKWAGGKTQLLDRLLEYVPKEYNTYIEPFLGGAALFFYLKPTKAILSDSNPELINCYEIVRSKTEELVTELKKHKNTEEYYYKIRNLKTEELDEISRAARFIYLNKTCYNGLYRVNKKGNFNVPFGKRKNPKIVDEERLYNSKILLKKAILLCEDYKTVLRRYAQNGDFVYLDPPYFPVGKYADFQRYTKDFFYDADHIELRNEFNRLKSKGIKVLLNNSNTEFIKKLFDKSPTIVIPSKRLINSIGSNRIGEDLLVYSTNGKKTSTEKEDLLENFPATRYMGSKYKLLPHLWDTIKDLNFNTALDAFAGSCCVSYMLKQKGFEVSSNDFLRFSSIIGKALIENSDTMIEEKDKIFLLKDNKKASNFISTTFGEIYFDKSDNLFLEQVRANIETMQDSFKKSIALAALSRACMKKRPRGIFTYIGNRYNDGRRDLKLSLREHFLDNIEAFNNAVINNGKKNKAFNYDIYDLEISADLVYIDPPYMTAKSDNDYTRRYHFVEGLVKNWEGLVIDHKTKTKKFKKYPTPFDSKKTVNDALDRLFLKFKKSILIVSYSSNSIPTKDEMYNLLKKYKNQVDIKEIDYTYSFGNQNHLIGNNSNKVKEYLFIAR